MRSPYTLVIVRQRSDSASCGGEERRISLVGVRLTRTEKDARVPFMTALREYTVAGALMSYGPSYADHCRRAADFVHQIVNGAKPGDLPVQQPTRLALVINLNTANALGLDLPPSFLANADEVIG